MAYVIAEPCVDVKDEACVDVCPVDCIYEFEGENQLYIHPEECIDCDACRPECPVEAIFPLADVPAQWQSYIEINSAIFETHSTADRVGGGGHEEAADEPAAAAGSDGAAAPVSSAEVAELTTLLKSLGSKEIDAAKALEDAVPLLEKMGIEITSE